MDQWRYAQQIDRRPVIRIASVHRGLVPSLIEILEADHFFRCLTVEGDGGVWGCLQALAANPPVLTDPLGRTRTPDFSAALSCPNTPEGVVDAMNCINLPYTLVLIVPASDVPAGLVEICEARKPGAKLVILD